MYGSARSSSSPPPASPARVTDALAGLVVDDDPRAAIAGLIRATPKRTRTSSAGSDDSNTALASPAASSAAAAAADVIARARAAAAGDDAVWRTAKAAVDAVAAATRPATFETKRKDSLGAGDAAHVVARAASARAEHAAEVAAAAAAHAAAAAAFARASPGAFADEEASAAARLADDAAEVATRAAADATAAAARAEQTSLRAASLRLAQLQGASVFANDGSLGGSGVLPPTPPAVKRRESANEKKTRSDAETTLKTFDGDGVGASGTRLAENFSEPRGKLESPEPKGLRSDLFDFDSNAKETRASPAPARAPGSLGKPRRVRISEHDALLFDAAEAKLALREGRRRAAAALAEAGTAEAKGAVARALASAGAAPARSDNSRLPQGHGIVASRRAVDAMDRAAARLMDRRDRNEGAPDETSASRSAGSDDFCVSETNVAANEGDGETKRRMKRRYDPGSFEVSLVNAHTRFHGEMNQTDKRLFEEDLRSARAATRAAAAAAAAGVVVGGGASDASSRRVGPRPTKKSQAAAAAAAERKRRAAEERAARLREAEAVVGSFAPFKASPAPSPVKPARFPAVRGAGKSASPASQSPSSVRAGTNAASPSRSSPTSAFARGSPRSRESPLSVAKEKGLAERPPGGGARAAGGPEDGQCPWASTSRARPKRGPPGTSSRRLAGGASRACARTRAPRARLPARPPRTSGTSTTR
jgi:hypothetical protein